MAKNRTYRMAYDIRPGEFSKQQLGTMNMGGCDAVIIHSILYMEDGSRSEALIHGDGRNVQSGIAAPLSTDELFKSWVMLAHELAEELPEGGRKEMARYVFELCRAATLKIRVEEEGSVPEYLTRINCNHCGHTAYVPRHVCTRKLND